MTLSEDNTLTFDDARRLTGPLAFNLMIKPAGSLCNLACRYCYYLDKAGIYGGSEPRMSLQMLETFTKAYIEANEVPQVQFNWHGGEPLLMGIDFYRKALELQRKYGAGKTISNTIQTNGTLLDARWASFLSDNGFLTGISIDGPQEIHDRYRLDRGGAPTFSKVMQGIEALQRAGAEFNTMTTISRAGEGHGLEVYKFLKSIGSRFMQFMPVVEHVRNPLSKSGKEDRSARPVITAPETEGSRLAPWSVSSTAFGTYMCDIFDEWVKNDVGTIFVNMFDTALANWCGVESGICAYAETCGGNSIIEHNGDLYPCDHFVYPEYRLGNLLEDDLKTLMTSSAQVKFGISKRGGLPRKCLKCTYRFACHGECPKHRFNHTDSGEKGLNVLCDGYFRFYKHIEPAMNRMKTILEKGEAPASIMSEYKYKTNN